MVKERETSRVGSYPAQVECQGKERDGWRWSVYSCTRVWSATPVQQLRCGCRSPVSTRCVVYFISSLSLTAHRRTKKKRCRPLGPPKVETVFTQRRPLEVRGQVTANCACSCRDYAACQVAQRHMPSLCCFLMIRARHTT